VRIGVLVSGTGTNLQALLDAQARGELAPGVIAAVVSNKPGVPALERATRAGVPAVVVDHRGLSREVFEDGLDAALALHGVEAVVLAGFMRVLTPRFVDRFPLRIVNTHPSLLPAFPGWHAVRQALEHGVKVTGCTVHVVTEDVDAGRILAQEAVPVLPDDTEGSLHERIKAVERRIYPTTIKELLA
jgi:phosphoribosylglycinamide formyltransferase-1